MEKNRKCKIYSIQQIFNDIYQMLKLQIKGLSKCNLGHALWQLNFSCFDLHWSIKVFCCNSILYLWVRRKLIPMRPCCALSCCIGGTNYRAPQGMCTCTVDIRPCCTKSQSAVVQFLKNVKKQFLEVWLQRVFNFKSQKF